MGLALMLGHDVASEISWAASEGAGFAVTLGSEMLCESFVRYRCCFFEALICDLELEIWKAEQNAKPMGNLQRAHPSLGPG